jgi:hypothetical protein
MSTMFRISVSFCLALAALLCSCNERQEAENPEVEVELERTFASRAETPQDVHPYDEALSWHEYRVKKVLSGKLDAGVIRVAHWTVLAAKAVPVSASLGEVVKLKVVPFESVEGLKNVKAREDFEFTAEEPPRFLDLSQSLSQSSTPSAVRYDYRGNVSDQMRLYWRLRGQLRAVAMGNSHAAKGIDPRAIMGRENWEAPLMLNMAPGGANNDQQCLMLREYVLDLPKLEWLFWVVSARTFNAKRVDTRKYQEFTASPGWLHDQKNKKDLWPVPADLPAVTCDELRKTWPAGGCDIWGASIIAKSLLPGTHEEQRKFIVEQCDSTRYAWSEEISAMFFETARAFAKKGVKVLILTTPTHPFTKEANACDPDGTTHKGFKEMVRHMEAFDKATLHVWFRDFHKDGAHEFPPEEFYDVDHLNRTGAGRLGAMIQAWMKECVAETVAAGAAAAAK